MRDVWHGHRFYDEEGCTNSACQDCGAYRKVAGHMKCPTPWDNFRLRVRMWFRRLLRWRA